MLQGLGYQASGFGVSGNGISSGYKTYLTTGANQLGPVSNYCDNYRAIAVGSVLGKLYAVILDTRLSVCAEKNGWRAEGQAGFRAGKSTVDHVFVLRHLIESTQKSRKVLYCCFVDFRKAFDRVRRDYLIQRLAELGVHGRMLQAIIQMYWSVPLVPKLHGTMGDAIPSTCGVKQGDPLSPLLFGLFIDEFVMVTPEATQCGSANGPKVSSNVVVC